MKVLMLIPGTGNFHCGSCLRDQTLARALRARGVDVATAALYLPEVTEQADGETSPMFFGGINAYLQQKSGLFRRTPRWVDAMLDATPLLRSAASVSHMTRAHDLATLTLSMLQGEQGRQVKELERLVAWIMSQPGERPDVVTLNNVLLIGLARRIRKVTGARIVCTLHGEDAFIDSLDEPHRGAAWQLLHERAADVDAFIAVSQYYGDLMTQRMRIDPAKMHVVHNGIDTSDMFPAPAPPAVPTIGYLARMSHGKGLSTLIDAFTLLKRDSLTANVKLRVGGAMTPGDKPYIKGLRAQLAEEGLLDDVTFEPNLTRERKIELLRSISVFSVPATYGESFGLYVVEAWACGVPVVQPDCAAFGELLAVGGGGILCEANDAASLAAGLKQLLGDPHEARRLGERGRQAVEQRFTADVMAAGVANVFERVVGSPGA